jgi:hypothetical protein
MEVNMTADFNQLAARCRRWKLTAITLALLLAVTFAVKARADLPYPERLRARTVEATEVVLRDDTGHVRARLAMEDNTALLTILDEHGKVIATVPQRPKFAPVTH